MLMIIVRTASCCQLINVPTAVLQNVAMKILNPLGFKLTPSGAVRRYLVALEVWIVHRSVRRVLCQIKITFSTVVNRFM